MPRGRRSRSEHTKKQKEAGRKRWKSLEKKIREIGINAKTVSFGAVLDPTHKVWRYSMHIPDNNQLPQPIATILQYLAESTDCLPMSYEETRPAAAIEDKIALDSQWDDEPVESDQATTEYLVSEEAEESDASKPAEPDTPTGEGTDQTEIIHEQEPLYEDCDQDTSIECILDFLPSCSSTAPQVPVDVGIPHDDLSAGTSFLNYSPSANDGLEILPLNSPSIEADRSFTAPTPNLRWLQSPEARKAIDALLALASN